MKIRIRSEVVIEREIDMTPEDFRRSYHADFGECRKWLSRKKEVKIHDKFDRYADHKLDMTTQVFVQGEDEIEHSENQTV